MIAEKIETPPGKKRVIVTGGWGVVGSTIARRLLNDGHVVVITDACEEPRNLWISRQFVKDQWHPGNEGRYLPAMQRLETEEAANWWRVHLEKADAVIHCAASTGIPHSVVHPDDDWRSNVDATRVLLEALRKHPVPTVVLSSVKPYEVPEGMLETKGLHEEEPLVPDEPYAASKAAQSMLAMAYARSYGIPVVTFRCSNLYGPAPCHGPRHGWLTWFAISAAIGRPLEVQGTGEQSRDMLHADDVFQACALAIGEAKRLGGRVFNLGGGWANRISVGEAAAECVRLAGGGEIRSAPARAMDDPHVFVNTGAFLRATGWRPQVAVKDGLRRVFEWARVNADELRKLYEEV